MKVLRILCAAVLALVLHALAEPASAQGFPTSAQAPTGTPWVEMNEAPFTGTLEEACSLMGLTPEQCTRYQAMRANGQCDVMQAPNGVVLDALTFSPWYGDTARFNVLVALVDPPTREVIVCDLGDGVVAMQFLGCRNHAFVRDWFPETARAPLECVWVEYDTSPPPQAPQHHGGILLPGACNCEKDVWIPSITINPPAQHRSRGGQLVCN
ncbi:hypothetical protein GVX82_01810 [Patescibacteria group bacterium]|nr:hypothetical protein [Patescibacteria group bacterium]